MLTHGDILTGLRALAWVEPTISTWVEPSLLAVKRPVIRYFFIMLGNIQFLLQNNHNFFNAILLLLESFILYYINV